MTVLRALLKIAAEFYIQMQCSTDAELVFRGKGAEYVEIIQL